MKNKKYFLALNEVQRPVYDTKNINVPVLKNNLFFEMC